MIINHVILYIITFLVNNCAEAKEDSTFQCDLNWSILRKLTTFAIHLEFLGGSDLFFKKLGVLKSPPAPHDSYGHDLNQWN